MRLLAAALAAVSLQAFAQYNGPAVESCREIGRAHV